MYKLLLVDDESEIREGLQEIIRFEDMGFTVVGEAKNGIEAIGLCETLAPDLIITDIRMPLMDGLTMCREIKKKMPTAHFIILSGYDDFEYARQAIELSSLRYLLKPISSVEFTKILKHVRETLDEEFGRRRDLTALQQNFQASLPLLREMLLSSLVSGGMSVETAEKTAPRYSLRLDAAEYVLALMRAADDRTGGAKSAIEDPELLSVAIRNIAQDVLSKRHNAYFFHYNEAIAILFLLPDQSDAAFSEVLSALEEAQKNIQHYLSAQALIGVSAPCDRLSQLGRCARQAVSALEQSSILSSDQVLCAIDLEHRSRSEFIADPQKLRALSNALKACDQEQCDRIIDALVDELSETRPTPRLYRTYMLDICMAVMHKVREVLTDPAEESDDFEKTLDALMHCPPSGQARSLLYGYCASVIRDIGDSRVTSSQQLVEQAVEILMAEYNREDMSIESVCLRLHISTSYFSVLFKRETHKTFHQYLIDLRMDRAMTLLAVGLKRTAEVAQAVGIPDPSYFSYAFKKHFGMSPSQARKKRGDA